MTDFQQPQQRDGESGRARKGDRARRGPKKATARYLENAALHYLDRYPTSRANLERILLAKVARSVRFHGTDRGEGVETVAALLEKFNRSGALDDRRYAETMVRSLHRRGGSARSIRAALTAKGVPGDLIDTALGRLSDDSSDPEFAAAVTFARKRRLGPFRNDGNRAGRRERDMAALGRKGFGYDLVRRVIDAADPEELERRLDELGEG